MRKYDLTTPEGRAEWERDEKARAEKERRARRERVGKKIEPRAPSPFLAFIAACQGDLEPLLASLREVGHYDLAEALAEGYIPFHRRLPDEHGRLVAAAREFREEYPDGDFRPVAKRWRKTHRGDFNAAGERLFWMGTPADARRRAIEECAAAFGVDAEKLSKVLDHKAGGTSRALRPYLPKPAKKPKKKEKAAGD